MSLLKKMVIRFSVLSVVQLLTVFFPLALYLVLIDRLSLSIIGNITTWQMIFYILASISSYSFPQNLIPITEKLKKSNKSVVALWNKLLQIRFLVICFVALLIITLFSFLPKICIFSSFLLLGKLFNPSSFFYVLAKNKLLLWYNFFSKFISLGLVFLFITKDNWFYTNLFIGLSEFIVSIVIIKIIKWPLIFSFIKSQKIITYLIRDKKLFYIQLIITLIMLITIPLTNLFFGSHIAGVVSILEKIVSVIRGVSGNLFFTILPNFSSNKKEELLIGIQKSKVKISFFTLGLFLFSLLIVFLFKEIISQKFQETSMFLYALILMIVWFPIMISTPYQVVCLKLSFWDKIHFNSKIQLIALVLGLILLGKLFGIWGIIASIILHETINYHLFRKAIY
jgi:O-antigen/teichoic acid export membrane protein